VPNGFDSSDYPTIENERNSRFTVTYTGTMYGRRTPKSFLAALQLLIERGFIASSDVLVRFTGRFGSEITAMFEAFPHQESLQIAGYMAHEDSIRQLLGSDALLLVVDESKESEEIVPGKVYEYMGAGKPIIAIAPPQGAIAHLLNETNAGRVAPQVGVEQLAAIIFDYYNDWKNRSEAFAPDREKIMRYERRNATKQLAALLSGDTSVNNNS
jgi:glycosyltransferase involved in cell wall biosynthesis